LAQDHRGCLGKLVSDRHVTGRASAGAMEWDSQDGGDVAEGELPVGAMVEISDPKQTLGDLHGLLALVCDQALQDDAADAPAGSSPNRKATHVLVRLLERSKLSYDTYCIQSVHVSQLKLCSRVPRGVRIQDANLAVCLQCPTFRAEAVHELEAARQLVEEASHIVVLTGAGISTDSGIPDFRGPSGIWTMNPAAESASTLQAFLENPEARMSHWRRVPYMFGAVKPNRGHKALRSLRHAGKLQLLVTQNIDGLHQAVGLPAEEVVEVHGSYARVQCLYCFTKHPTKKLLDEYRPQLDSVGQPNCEPRCPRCGGMLKPDVVLFGEALPEDALGRAFDAASSCDLLLCIGTSLTVAPVNDMVKIAQKADAHVVILNGSPTPMNHLADVFVEASISKALPVLTAFDESNDAFVENAGGNGENYRGSCGADDVTPMWKDNGFAPWLPAWRLDKMDKLVAQMWMSGGMPDWPPAVVDGSAGTEINAVRI